MCVGTTNQVTDALIGTHEVSAADHINVTDHTSPVVKCFITKDPPSPPVTVSTALRPVCRAMVRRSPSITPVVPSAYDCADIPVWKKYTDDTRTSNVPPPELAPIANGLAMRPVLEHVMASCRDPPPIKLQKPFMFALCSVETPVATVSPSLAVIGPLAVTAPVMPRVPPTVAFPLE